MFHFNRLPLRTPWLRSLLCSSALHCVAATLLAAELVWAFLPSPLPRQRSSLVLESVPAHAESSLPIVELAPEPATAWMAASAQDLSALVESVDEPRWHQAVLEAQSADENTSTSADFITSELLRSIAAAEQQTPDANLARLEALSDQLNTVSTAESIDQISAALQGWLGTSQRATQPAAEPIAGEIDLSTAQLHDVLRDESAGDVRYTAVLLDAAGRTSNAPLTAEEGESIYRVMQLMKENPLLERVYRGIVLSLFDKLMQQRQE